MRTTALLLAASAPAALAFAPATTAWTGRHIASASASSARTPVRMAAEAERPKIDDFSAEELAAGERAFATGDIVDADSFDLDEPEAIGAADDDPAVGAGKRGKKAGKIVNENGVAYAPWMDTIDDSTMKRIREERQALSDNKPRNSEGSLRVDPQAQELGSAGLKWKMVGDEVQLTWETDNEAGNKGFTVSKRAARTEEFTTVQTYETDGGLTSMGPDGGIYEWIDASTEPGRWIYRISDTDKRGRNSDLCQTLVEIETDTEQKGTVFALAGLGAILVGLVGAGALFDPLQ